MADLGVVIMRWVGRLACVLGLGAWSYWLGWRISIGSVSAPGLVVLALELVAFGVASVLTAAYWSAPFRTPVATDVDRRILSDVVAAGLGLDALSTPTTHGPDDTGEVARARLGLRTIDPRRRARRGLAMTAWALVAVEGIRRMLFVGVLVAVLLSGGFPFDVPAWTVFAPLVASQILLGVGHWLLTGGVVRPGARLRWSMASVGAGLGDGTSRSGLPIRWTATIATMVVLNLAVSLRGVSDRWTHGLGAMARDERVVAMALAWWLVLVGFTALRILPKPSLGYYGATRRLEETSTRRLALGTTVVVALVGFVAGVLPGGLPA
jgi:hypothetical protein